MKININNINKAFENNKIFENFNLELTDEKINCIVGQSGCGKSTFLKLVSGLIDVDSGEINGVNPRDISYIFQEDRLIEHLTIKQNLELALKKYYDNKNLNGKINELLELLDIKDIKDEYSNSLSGGMKQRVNIARAFGKPSKIILMDEPFKSLDYKLKYDIINEFISILKKNNRMVILVTHDLDEAIYFDGNIFVFGNKPVVVKAEFKENLNENRDNILKLI